ncbi:MAG TPA: DEAD/DEAH box helicase family protein [Solirubrobacteraceae bacterium]|nr:DEAD/DEAH box helicase family protein [Solirubrobacteraceae bacterium]
MKLTFDPALQHQVDAISAISDLFAGCLPDARGLSAVGVGGVALGVSANPAPLDEPRLLTNLRSVQRRQSIHSAENVGPSEESIDSPDGPKVVRFPNVAIDMETGTGKTYTYLRGALELHRRYGVRKFVIVVPTVAIREGVLKSLSITREHFRDLYPEASHTWFEYRSTDLSQIFSFAASEHVEFMVVTLDSVNKDSNVLRSRQDRARGQVPLHVLQAVRPILLLDEPQTMTSSLAREALASFDPLAALHFSATHRAQYPTLFRLTPFEAYRRGLVKRIEVESVVATGAAEGAFVRLTETGVRASKGFAKLTVHKLSASRIPAERSVTVRLGNDLVAKTNGNRDYDGYIVTEIHPDEDRVVFANGVEITASDAAGDDRDEIMRLQVRSTVRTHMARQERLLALGYDAKVLSLFFLEHVDDYVLEDGKVRRWFVDAYNELAPTFQHFAQLPVERVHGGYFAKRKVTGGALVEVDSRVGRESQADQDAYRLIMRDKERLLGFESDLRFIFSHSALREGWDTPNVCQVCTLARGDSIAKKRQEIGRGVRLLVDTQGRRIADRQANVLTVVANESYQRFAERLQQQWEDDGGVGQVPVQPVAPVTVTARPQVRDGVPFAELWEAISRRSTYQVAVRTEHLIETAVTRLREAVISPPAVQVTHAVLHADATTDSLRAVVTSLPENTRLRSKAASGDELVTLVQDGLANRTPGLYLTRATIARIVISSGRLGDALAMPREVGQVLVAILHELLPQEMALSIRYTVTDDRIPPTILEESFEAPPDMVVATPSGANVYDHAVVESGPERTAVATLEALEPVKAYLKLPSRFTIPTPLGTYNPDWAIAVADADGTRTLHLVRETKSGDANATLRPSEAAKISCGTAHFAALLGVEYARWDGTLQDLRRPSASAPSVGSA